MKWQKERKRLISIPCAIIKQFLVMWVWMELDYFFEDLDWYPTKVGCRRRKNKIWQLQGEIHHSVNPIKWTFRT